MSDERRGYFRVSCEVMLSLEGIAPEAEQATISQFAMGTADEFTLATRFTVASREMEALHRRIAAQNPDVAAYLSNLEHKLDVVAKLMLRHEIQSQPSEVVQATLSASGIGIETRAPREAGELCRLRMVLLPEHTGVDLLARVQTCTERGDGRYQLGFNFEHVHESDRELLIQHVLEVQGRQLREASGAERAR